MQWGWYCMTSKAKWGVVGKPSSLHLAFCLSWMLAGSLASWHGVTVWGRTEAPKPTANFNRQTRNVSETGGYTSPQLQCLSVEFPSEFPTHWIHAHKKQLLHTTIFLGNLPCNHGNWSSLRQEIVHSSIFQWENWDKEKFNDLPRPHNQKVAKWK